MNTAFVVAHNELRRLFLSPFAWLVLSAVQFLLAIFFYLLLSKFMEAGPAYANRGLTEVVVVGLLQVAGLVMLLISPVITMRAFSDELRHGTIKLVLSSPLSITEFVLGKYLAYMAFYFLLVMLIALMPLSLGFGTRLDFGLITSGLLGLTLLLSAFAAIGLFVSSLCHSSALAALGSFVLCFLLWISHIVSDSANPRLGSITDYLSLQKHFNALLSGAFSSVDVIYYVLLSLLFIMLSIWSLDAMRTHQ